eukprot:TRINITY_DN13376_c0_g2_i1.p1 TRINITY_DN13376_c0_g2~~TRINITY_DN13376_c0_g2_i1.p1  ORF type:complete len:263 (-),score=48.70 TRINITY_DN13376_c0_g2_i1:80-868(-)
MFPYSKRYESPSPNPKRYQSPSPTRTTRVDLDCPPLAPKQRKSLWMPLRSNDLVQVQKVLEEDPMAALVLSPNNVSAMTEACACGCSIAMLELLLHYGAGADEPRSNLRTVAPLAALAGAPLEQDAWRSRLPPFDLWQALSELPLSLEASAWPTRLASAAGGVGFHETADPRQEPVRLAAARFLLAAGANPERLDSSGRIAACWARASGWHELAALLEAARELQSVAFLRLMWRRTKPSTPHLLTLPAPAKVLLCQHLAPQL